MKRIIFSLAMALLSMSAICQTTAAEIIERYNKISGFDKVAIAKNTSMFMEVDLDTPQGLMPIKMTKGDAAQFRVEMSIMGKDVLVVTDGKKGWIKVPDQAVQPMPKEALAKITSQGDVTNSLKMDNELLDYTFLEEKDGVQILNATPKADASKLGIIGATFSFDKKSGMLVGSTSKLKQNGKEIVVVTSMSDVKDFSGLKIPSKMIVEVTGVPKMTLIVRNMVMDYPTTAFMFAKPE